MRWLDETWEKSLTPADTREIWEWAEQEGELPSVYAKSGKLDIDTCPMICEPLRALRNPIVRSVTVMAGVQCLKTLLGELWLLWSIVNDPGPTQWLQPDDQEAKEHALERFIPLIEKFPAVHKFYTGNRHDKQTAFIRFVHMFLRMEGAHNPGNTQRKSIKNQMRSEVWQADKWIKGRLKEASSRQERFVHNSKTYTESQPGWDEAYDVDDMHAEFKAGDQCQLQFACESCKKFQPFLWEFRRHDGTRGGIIWEDSDRTRRPNGEWRWQELKQTVRYECIHCGHRHTDDPITRRRMTSTLKFVAQNPDADPAHRSFTWNQLAMPDLSWFQTKIGGVYNFLLAHEQAKRGFDKPLRDFWMKVPAVPYNPAEHSAIGDMETIELALNADPLKAPQIEHKGIKFTRRIMAVDVQEDHFWVLVEIYSERGDSLTLHFEKVFTWDDIAERQKNWQVLEEDVMVDVSHRRHEVKVECARHGRWEIIKGKKRWICWKALEGSDQETFIWVKRLANLKTQRIQLPYSHPPQIGDPCAGMAGDDPRRREFSGKTCMVIAWSNPTIKDVAINRRDGKTKGIVNLVMRGAWNKEFSRQMHSQRKAHIERKTGGGKWGWVKFRDDHGLDCKCMAIVRAFQCGFIIPVDFGPGEEKKAA